MDFEIYWTLIGGDTHFANRKPYFFILDFQAKRRQELSFQQYYAKYGTTEERDGWHMQNPTGQKVIYVKN